MDSNLIGKEELLSTLAELGIDCKTVEHPQVFTVEEAIPHIAHLSGVFAKNLFLKDKKKKLFLFCAPHDAKVKLNDLGRAVRASGGLRFADEATLYEKLGLTQGAVTIFGLINDRKCDVQLLLDSRFVDGSTNTIYFHPMVNSASTGISHKDLLIFLDKTGHKPVTINVENMLQQDL